MEHRNSIDVKLESEVKKMLMHGQKIEAVVLVQNSLKIGLKNSKDLVDRIEESQESNTKRH